MRIEAKERELMQIQETTASTLIAEIEHSTRLVRGR